MAQTLIDLGIAGSTDGDTLYEAFGKVNFNIVDLESFIASLSSSITTSNESIFNTIRVGKGNGGGVANTRVGEVGLDNCPIGSYNTAIGYAPLRDGLNPTWSTAIGYASGLNAYGTNGTYIGANSGVANTLFTNVTCIGVNSNITASNQVQLGDSATTTYVYGTVQNRSDLRDKADVQDTVLGLDFISKLRPVDYRWDMRESYKEEFPELPLQPNQGDISDEEFEVIMSNYSEDCKAIMNPWLENNKIGNLTHDGSKKRNRYHHGFIAQEVRDLGVDFGGFQDHSINGGEDVLSIGYDELIAPIVKAIQELKAEIELLK